MEKHGLTDYVVVPREIATAYRQRLINRPERDVYLWMRVNANPYGIAIMTLEGIAEDVLGSSKKKNYANRILLSLKSKRWVYYEQRSGQRGSFEVHFGDWILPTRDEAGKNRIKTLDPLFENAAKRKEKLVLSDPHSEDYAEADLQFQRLEKPNVPDKQANNRHVANNENSTFRGSYNDTEHENETETNHTFASSKRDFSLEGFKPKSYEEETCLAIARELREPDMCFIIGSLKKHGFLVIEKAYLKLKKAVEKGGIDNPRRLFNSIIQQAADPDTAHW